MGTVPTPPTITTNQFVTSTVMNQYRDPTNFLLNPPQVNAYRSGALSPTTSTWTLVGLDVEVFDVFQSGDSPGHDNATNNSRLICRTAGKYEMTGQTTFDPNGTGTRGAMVRLNAAGNAASGTQLIWSQVTNLGAGSGTTCPAPTQVYPLVAGDYIELFCWQSSGAGLAISTGLSLTFLRMKWVGS